MFVRLDGIFKEFCRKIVMDELQKIKDSGSSISMSDIDAFEEYRKRYTKVEEENDDHNVTKADEQTEIPNKESTDNNPQENIKQEAAEKQYYFIIDEINRADLSKVFGEIMYCLDEDYRGPENAIQTQYSALNTYHKVIKDDGSGKDITTYEEYDFDCFEKGFFIPHNLHIIGTMNDIDRSVESFDFALRRRFIWKELDANGSINELKKIVTSEKIKSTEMNLSDLKDKAIRINNLFDLEPQAGNKEPEFKDIKRLGLNKQYQLGKAYYKDFDGSKSSLEKIYRGKIEPIIKEYTRGRDANIVKNFLDKVKENL